MATRTYSITNKSSGAELGPITAESPEAALRTLCLDFTGDASLMAALDAGELWTCMGEHGMRGELGDLRVDPLPADEELACECSEWSGHPCAWRGPADEAVAVEFMPVQHRDLHTTAGNRGTYPANGARRIMCAPACAAAMIEADGDWCSIVEARRLIAGVPR